MRGADGSAGAARLSGHYGGRIMSQYECVPCGYIYDPEVGDPENGIEPGTAFSDLPDDWVCPVCSASKDEFEKL